MNAKSPHHKRSAATVADVAREAGCSPMTVSRAINGGRNVRESTRKTVLEAVARLNYSPNLAARTLAAASQIRIGLLYSNPSPAYLSRFLLGCLDQARTSNVQIVVENCGVGREPEIAAIRDLVTAGVDGIVLSPPLCDRDYVLDTLEELNVTAVAVANWRPPRALSVVRIDDRRASAAMVRHILSLGHRRIGFIKGHVRQKASYERLQGYHDAMREAGIKAQEGCIAQGDFTYRSGLEAAEKLLSQNPRPTAIFASNDDMAAATVAIAHRLHIDVPKQLTVCGFDNTDFAQSIWPELTTVNQPITDMSRSAVTELVAQIRRRREGEDPRIGEILFDYILVERGSQARCS